ncbi:ATP-binding protein [Rahnella sp. Lac-M11]|uniref:ATP-binding protein n=1 Tax=Rahnella contaminans TaxID=2703882 RepID=A0A6M2B562_9GAMM|nr:ATP-binding protein [Rahnella contaminans]NGX87624.1 ATP-binding protein [Rahnella contaminans]
MNTENQAMLHILCGKIASGKSTLARELATQPFTVVVSEDRWLSALFKEEMRTIEDYVRCSAKLRSAIAPHVVSLLSAGVSVVLDFPANTVANRQWMMSIIHESGADHRLHFLNVSADVCKSRLHVRNQSGTHDFVVTDEQFELISRHFAEPQAEEGFTIIQYDNGNSAETGTAHEGTR